MKSIYSIFTVQPGRSRKTLMMKIYLVLVRVLPKDIYPGIKDMHRHCNINPGIFKRLQEIFGRDKLPSARQIFYYIYAIWYVVIAFAALVIRGYRLDIILTPETLPIFLKRINDDERGLNAFNYCIEDIIDEYEKIIL
jgi:hypothetical protein